jgi:hypothetical protein
LYEHVTVNIRSDYFPWNSCFHFRFRIKEFRLLEPILRWSSLIVVSAGVIFRQRMFPFVSVCDVNWSYLYCCLLGCMSCVTVGRMWCFGGTYCLLHQGRFYIVTESSIVEGSEQDLVTAFRCRLQ